MEEEAKGIRVKGMQFGYDFQNPIFVDFSLNISPGSRCLLVGANGSGISFFSLYYLSLYIHLYDEYICDFYTIGTKYC